PQRPIVDETCVTTSLQMVKRAGQLHRLDRTEMSGAGINPLRQSASSTEIHVERCIISPRLGSIADAQAEHRNQRKHGLASTKPSDLLVAISAHLDAWPGGPGRRSNRG